MSKIKEIKVQKFRKLHIWPSVVMLMCSLFVIAVASAVFMCLTLAYFAKERLNAACLETERVGQMLSEQRTEAERSEALEYFQRSIGFSESLYLLDADWNKIAGYGEATYDEKRSEELWDGTGVRLYADESVKINLINEKGEIDIAKILESGMVINLSNFQSQNDLRAVVIEMPYWIAVPANDQTQVIAKWMLRFYVEDFRIVFIIGVVTAALMFLPNLFLIGKLISNAVHQRSMVQLLYMDPITSGHNWMYFEHNAEKTLCARRNADKLYAVVDITLMKYMSYCTCHGMEAGERLLEEVDQYFARLMNHTECSAYYGKASYALLLDCGSKEDGIKRVKDMIGQMPQGEKTDSMITHAGIYFVEPVQTEGGKAGRRKQADIAEYYNQASTARTAIEDGNQSRVMVFDRALLEERLWEHRVEDRMQSALDNEEFQVYLQPKYNPVTEELVGAEALVRWINEEDGFISPGRFIPIFEKNGFITKLDDYMVSHVAKLQAKWLAQGKNVVPVSVNISRAHFANPDLARHLCALVDAYQIPHYLIEIELTESAFFDDKLALLTTVNNLKEMGFDISMDDFGAGYSSLNSLKDLPLDVLKLDAEFFRGEDDEVRGEIVVSQAIDLAKKLNMRIVAEGVEKKNQVDFLAAHDCDMIQGFYFAKPMPADEYEEKLDQKGSREDE